MTAPCGRTNSATSRSARNARGRSFRFLRNRGSMPFLVERRLAGCFSTPHPRGPDAETHPNGARESAGRTAALRRAHVMKLLTWTSAVMLAASSVAVAQPTDTTRISHEPLFTSRDAWIAAGFVAGTIAMYPADRYFARKLQSPHNQENQFLSDAATGLRFMGTPGSMIIGVTMYGAG